MAVINNNLPKHVQDGVKFVPVELQPEQFDKLIQTHGVRVRVYKTMLCPNVKKIDSGEHEIDCDMCHGTAFLDRSPIETWAFIQNQTLNREFAREGTWDDQNVASSFLRGVELQYFAKVELIDFTTTFYELIQRQEGQLDRLKYAAFAVETVIDQNGVTYEPEADFVLSNGDVLWTNNNHKPAIGTIYTIYYVYPITFRAVNALHVNRFSQRSNKIDHLEPVQMNEQWIMKRDYLITREDLSGNPLQPNKNMVVTTPDE